MTRVPAIRRRGHLGAPEPRGRARACGWGVLLCLLGACRHDANANLERGDRLLALGQHKQAIVEYQTALNLEPSAHAQRGLGLAYEALSAFAQAQRHLQAAIEAKPDDSEAYVALARIQTHFGQYEKARAELLEALTRAPDQEDALLLLGVYAEARPDVQRALDLLEAHLERERRLGHASSHETELVLADLMARVDRADVADKLRENIRYSATGNPRLTLELARASADRDNDELTRQLLLPLVERYPNESDAWQTLAAACIELGRFSEARAALSHLSERKGEPEVRFLWARLGLAAGLETEPTRALGVLLQELPGDQLHQRAAIRRVLGQAMADQHQPDAAVRELSALLAEQPGDVEGSLALAELELGQGNSEHAIQILSALTDNHGRLSRAYQLLGRAYLERKQVELAEQAFRRLWELAPQEPDARYWLGVTLHRRGQLDQARRLLEGNLKRFSKHAPSLTALTSVLEESGGIELARTFLLGYGREHAESPEVASVEAEWLLAHRDVEHGLAAYRRALVLDPGYYPAVSALSLFYARHGRSNLAQATIEAAVAHDSQDITLFLLAARVSRDLRRYEQGVEYCKRALESNPDYPAALAELATLHAEGFRDVALAKTLASRAYAAAPSNPVIADALGWVTHLAGDPAGALPYLEQAVRNAPADPRLTYHLGAALLATGQPSAANERFARVLELDPLFPTANELRLLLARR